MPQPGTPWRKLGFLAIGPFDRENPGPGHQATLEMISFQERPGFGTMPLSLWRAAPGAGRGANRAFPADGAVSAGPGPRLAAPPVAT